MSVRRSNVDDDQAALAVASDALGYVLVGGRFTGSIDFGGGPVVTPMANDTDAFLARLHF